MDAGRQGVRNVNLDVQALALDAGSGVGREAQRDDGVGKRADLCRDVVIAAEFDLDRLARGPVEDQLGLDLARRDS